MALPPVLQNLRIPAFGAPLFIIQNPDMVIAQCKAGIPGCFPALNAREADGDPPLLDAWLTRIKEELDRHNQANPDRPAAPYAINQIVHRSNARLERDIEIMVKHEVPICVCSLGAREEVYEAVHSYGGIALHDIINDFFARKAIAKGADGLIAVAAGAGGHAGALSPFALIAEIREWFDGPLLLSGSISEGNQLLAAQAMGADLGYIGTAFIATEEANADPEYKQMLVDCTSDDIVYSNLFTGVHGNYLKPSISRAGMDPDDLPESDASKMNFSSGSSKPKSWKEIWGAGQGIAAIKEVETTAAMVDRLEAEYLAAQARLGLTQKAAAE
ncbi:MAG: NAD(P)H-dependent flavin oxidoreductase [Paracoccaceae bacterium]